MPQVPDTVYNPSYGPKTSTESALDQDWDSEEPEIHIPRGSPIRTETYTSCRFVHASEGEESVPEKNIAVLANGCLAYSILYECEQITTRYWVHAPADILLDLKSTTLTSEYRTVVICGDTVEADPSPVWLPPGRYEAAPRQAESVRRGDSEYLIYRDHFWDLIVPVVMLNRCDGVAKYKRVIRVQTFLLPGRSLVSETTEDFSPETIKEAPFHVPGCE
jgi:hypothetical protein